MRILATLNSELSGVVTENGNISGEITVGGTIGLIIFGGVFTGIFGGLVYVLVRRWVPGSGVWKGLAFGGILFLLVGFDILDKDNVDFTLFGPPLLAVVLFALLFPLYGLLLSLTVERLNRTVPSLFYSRSVTFVGYVLVGPWNRRGAVSRTS